GDEVRTGAQAELIRTLQKQGVEVSRASASFTVTVPARTPPPRPTPTTTAGRDGQEGLEGLDRIGGPSDSPQEEKDAKPPAERKTESRTFPAGSYIIRMDQPYSRIADSLLDYQYWSPNDPQRTPYDDTGWTFPELFNVRAIRVTDARLLDAPV